MQFQLLHTKTQMKFQLCSYLSLSLSRSRVDKGGGGTVKFLFLRVPAVKDMKNCIFISTFAQEIRPPFLCPPPSYLTPKLKQDRFQMKSFLKVK